MASTGWEAELERWLAPFLQRLGRAERRRWAPLYLKGLLLPGERKSIEPLAQRVCPGQVQQLHHFISGSLWQTPPLQEVLFEKADRLLGGCEAVLSIDATALVKQGASSVGVARQYGGELGKKANGQRLVTLTRARGEGPLSLWRRLFLPQSGATDAERCQQAGLPEASRVHRPKWEVALDGVDQARVAGVRFGSIAADTEYGKAPEFRRGRAERGLLYAVGLLPQQRAYPADGVRRPPVRMRPTGRPPKHPPPSLESRPVADLIDALGADAFEAVTWRRGTQGPLPGAAPRGRSRRSAVRCASAWPRANPSAADGMPRPTKNSGSSVSGEPRGRRRITYATIPLRHRSSGGRALSRPAGVVNKLTSR